MKTENKPIFNFGIVNDAAESTPYKKNRWEEDYVGKIN
jgi:hypothetical protein